MRDALSTLAIRGSGLKSSQRPGSHLCSPPPALYVRARGKLTVRPSRVPSLSGRGEALVPDVHPRMSCQRPCASVPNVPMPTEATSYAHRDVFFARRRHARARTQCRRKHAVAVCGAGMAWVAGPSERAPGPREEEEAADERGSPHKSGTPGCGHDWPPRACCAV